MMRKISRREAAMMLRLLEVDDLRLVVNLIGLLTDSGGSARETIDILVSDLEPEQFHVIANVIDRLHDLKLLQGCRRR